MYDLHLPIGGLLYGHCAFITAINGAKYPETCFHNPGQPQCFPNTSASDPDNDGIDEQ